MDKAREEEEDEIRYQFLVMGIQTNLIHDENMNDSAYGTCTVLQCICVCASGVDFTTDLVSIPTRSQSIKDRSIVSV